MTKLNILIIPPNDLLRHPIPNRLYHIGKRLSQYHNIYLLSYPEHPLANSKKIRDMNCNEILFTPLIKTDNLGLYYVASIISIRNVLLELFKKVDIDVIISANILPSYVASNIASMYRIPIIFDYLDHFPESASVYYMNAFIRKMVYGSVYELIKHNLYRSTRIVTVSYTFRRLILNIIRNKDVIIIPNGIDHKIFRPISMEKARKKLGINLYDYILLYYGSIDAWVNFEIILKTIAYLKRMSINILLILMGFSHNKELYYKLKKYIKKYELYKNVLLLPPQPYEKVPLYINASNIVVAPYKKIIKNYTTPLKVLEALACAKPVVTSEITEFKLWFYRMPIKFYKQEKELQNIITILLKSYDSLKFELIKASEKIRHCYSWSRLVNLYKKLIEEL